MTYAPGDTVRLKSSGPAMTVTEIIETNRIRTQWFMKELLQTGVFLNVVVEPSLKDLREDDDED
jgi:uncharacterized protein YodC (DUF2158 family)